VIRGAGRKKKLSMEAFSIKDEEEEIGGSSAKFW